MENLLLMVAVLAYSLSAGVRVSDSGDRPPWLRRGGDVSLWVALTVHLIGLVALTVSSGKLPLATPGGSVATLSWFIGVGSLFVGRKSKGQVLTGVLSGLVSVLLGLALLLPNELAVTDTSAASLWFPVHALFIVLGLSAFALAFGVSLTYLMVRKRLKSKQLKGLANLPSIERLDRLNMHAAVFGFISLTIGIAAGGAWTATRPGGHAGLGPIVGATLVLWAWYAAAVLVRVAGGWRGRLSALFSVVGFIGMAVGLGTVLLLMKGWH